MKDKIEPKETIETVDLVSLKSVSIEGETVEPKMITIRKDIYEKHVKIKAEYLNDYILVEENQKDKIVKVENEQLIPIVEPEKPIEPEIFEPNNEANDHDPFIGEIKLKESFVETNQPEIKEPLDKPKKSKKERIKASK